MNTDKQLKTLEMAILHGSHFERKLADAAISADPINKALIFRCFPDLVANYGPDSSFFIAAYGKPSHLKVIK